MIQFIDIVYSIVNRSVNNFNSFVKKSFFIKFCHFINLFYNL
jgi:hypothetical protein